MTNLINTRQFSYRVKPDGSGFKKVDGIVEFRNTLNFAANVKRTTLQLINAYASTSIPNILNTAEYDNSKIKASRDGGTTWVTIQLDNGIYDTADLTNSINYALASIGWTNDAINEPLIEIYANEAVQKIYIVLDSTHLIGGPQIALDLSASKIFESLGFTLATSVMLIDGSYDATNYAALDVYGNTMQIEIELNNSYFTIENGERSNVVGIVDLTSSNGGNLYNIDTASTAEIDFTLPQYISNFGVKFKGSRYNNLPIYMLNPEIFLIFVIREYM